MALSLEPYLRVVAPRLAPDLASPPAVETLLRVARELPPISRVLLECGLGEGGVRVDLSLCVRRTDPIEGRRLEAWAATAAPPAVGAALAGLAAGWRDPSSIAARCVVQAWLELDLPPGASAPSATAIFLGLAKGSMSRDDGAAILARLLPLLPAPAAPAGAMIERAFAALPEGARVSFIGAFADRGSPTLRINVARLGAGASAGYLEALGWRDTRGLAASLTAEVERCGARPVLCLDLGAGALPRLGIECMIDAGMMDSAPWRPLLDALVDRGLCTPARRAAVLGFPGVDEPTSDAWPVELILAALLGEPTRAPVIARHVNHLKIALTPDAVLDAKAYLGLAAGSVGLDRGKGGAAELDARD